MIKLRLVSEFGTGSDNTSGPEDVEVPAFGDDCGHCDYADGNHQCGLFHQCNVRLDFDRLVLYRCQRCREAEGLYRKETRDREVKVVRDWLAATSKSDVTIPVRFYNKAGQLVAKATAKMKLKEG